MTNLEQNNETPKFGEFKGTKGKWILDVDDMLTVRAINDDGRVFITKSDTVAYYEKGHKFLIAKAKAKGDSLEVERLRNELFEFDEQQFANARLISKAPEMLDMLKELISENTWENNWSEKKERKSNKTNQTSY